MNGSEPVRVLCPNCQKRLRVPPVRQAVNARCPRCQHRWQITPE